MPVSAKHLRAKARERVRRYRAQQAEAGERRLDIKLPADVVAALDAARGSATRSDVMLEALKDWLHRRQPAAPAPAPSPAPVRRTRRPRRITV
jgi:hypothetical protein